MWMMRLTKIVKLKTNVPDVSTIDDCANEIACGNNLIRLESLKKT